MTAEFLKQQHDQRQQFITEQDFAEVKASTYELHFNQPARQVLQPVHDTQTATTKAHEMYPLYGGAVGVSIWTDNKATAATATQLQPFRRQTVFTQFAHGECVDKQFL